MSQTFGFRTAEGYFAWVRINGDDVICYLPQFGGWYETKHVLDKDLDMLSSAKVCLESNLIFISGDGERMLLEPGQYHPRVWRGAYRPSLLSDTYDKLNPLSVYDQTFTRSIVAAESLFLEVKDLFRVVEPQSENFDCFGHRFRELLMLLCTEIEACWAGVLKANDLEVSANGRYTTRNYIKVCTPLRLTEWKVQLKDYGLTEFQPFRYWNILQTTSSLPWYDAYNKVKHDREENFSKGTLGNVLQAAAALHIMQLAQFGPGIFDQMRTNRFSIFETSEAPQFDISEIYLSEPIQKGEFRTAVKLA